MFCAPNSGAGKTTIVAAVARFHRNQGRKVHVFKTGPDFLDPKILEQASGETVHQLDLWMVGEEQCKNLLYKSAQEADLILIEGVMGLFDGNPSSAELAKTFGIPIITIINAEAMAQTFGAIAYGLANYDKKLNFAGVIANRVASSRHADMLEQSISNKSNFIGSIYRDASITLPDRHLGLFQANEINDLEQRIENAADQIKSTKLSLLPTPSEFKTGNIPKTSQLLKDIKIGIARDDAFSFLYAANIDALELLGAELSFFSPLTDTNIPNVDCLYFPGGYPELHAEILSKNKNMHHAIKQHYEQNKCIVAECGGMMYLIEKLITIDGDNFDMVGIISGTVTMQARLSAIGAQSTSFNNKELRGHTYHYSLMETSMDINGHATRHYDGKKGESIFRSKKLFASYVHWYFASNLEATAELFKIN